MKTKTYYVCHRITDRVYCGHSSAIEAERFIKARKLVDVYITTKLDDQGRGADSEVGA